MDHKQFLFLDLCWQLMKTENISYPSIHPPKPCPIFPTVDFPTVKLSRKSSSVLDLLEGFRAGMKGN